MANSKNLKLVWLYFAYYWVIFGIGTYFGQYLPDAWRPTASMVVFGILMISLFVRGFNRSGPVISHIYAILIGVVSYGLFESFIRDFGPGVFYRIVLLGILVFLFFGVIGYFFLRDITHWGRYLFVALLVLIFASLMSFFIDLPYLHLGITVVGLILYVLFTMYDFNRMKNRKFSEREMGFNLFINLLIIIKRMLRLYRYMNKNR
ncbi:Bax inhibitor-1/YccA family protein [Salinicoccus carnicancri]|uniref:Bax inhibitor-1/YccA family protein n=1 Tax=Salinicoccus carnicancri TaxID=558170 RepID=UPI00031D98AA|nr:Bax inhibitor-1 family protein [Salinicoccus carnicancri]